MSQLPLPRLWALCALLALAAPSHAVIASFPWLEVSPQSPTTVDSVEIQLVLGLTESACAAMYTGVTCTVTPNSAVDSLPGYVVRLSYSTPSATCDTGSQAHGPTCNLGLLLPGHYRVVDNVTGTDIATFRVVPPGSAVFGLAGGVVQAGLTPEPVAGAVLVLDRADAQFLTMGKSAAAAALQYHPMGLTRSDATGSFAFCNLRSGIYRVIARAAGHDSTLAHYELNRELSVKLPLVPDGAVGSLAGIVRTSLCSRDTSCDFAPVPGCSLWVGVTIRDSSPASSSGYRTVFYLGVTDAIGAFRIDSVPVPAHAWKEFPSEPGFYYLASRQRQVYARAPGFLEQTLSAAIEPSCTTQVTFTLYRPFTHTAIVTRDSIDYVLATHRPVLGLTEDFRVRYQVRNRSSRAVTFEFDSTCVWDGFCGFKMIALDTLRDTLSGYTYSTRCTPTPVSVIVPAGDSVSLGELAVWNRDRLRACILRAWLRGYGDTTAVELLVRFVSPDAAVSRPVSISRRNSAEVRGDRVVLNLADPQVVTVSVFTADGRRVGRPASQRFGAGTHALALPRSATGLLLVRVTGPDFTFAGMVRSR